jgi:hypothetical protein
LSKTGQSPPAAHPPSGGDRWKLDLYLNVWHSQIVNLLKQHAARATKIALNETQPIDARENEEVFLFSEWKD